MPYGLYFTSIDPVKRRMAQSPDSVSPGFTGVIATIDPGSRTCDVWVQGTTAVLKGVRYGTALEIAPSYIKVGSTVYMRHPRGNKFQIEIMGPAFAIPSSSAGTTGPVPDPPPLTDAVNGLVPLPPATRDDDLPNTGTMHVPIFRDPNANAVLSGTVYSSTSFPLLKVGDDQDTTRFSGFTSGVMKVGQGYRVGYCYASVPIPAANATQYQWYTIEMGKSDRLLYRQAGALSNGTPVVPTVPSTRVLMATILVRPSATKIWNNDLGAVLGNSERIFVTPNQRRLAYQSTGVYADLTYTVTVRDSGGTAVSGRLVQQTLSTIGNTTSVDDLGSITSTTVSTNASGQATFVYRRTPTTNRSVRLSYSTQPPVGTLSVSTYTIIYNGAEDGYPLP